MFDESGFSLLDGDRVDDRLALHALQSGFDDLPFGGVDHEWNFADIRLAGAQVQKAHHRRLAVEHAFIHVEIDDLCAILHLGAAHMQRLLILFVEYQPLEHG